MYKSHTQQHQYRMQIFNPKHEPMQDPVKKFIETNGVKCVEFSSNEYLTQLINRMNSTKSAVPITLPNDKYCSYVINIGEHYYGFDTRETYINAYYKSGLRDGTGWTVHRFMMGDMVLVMAHKFSETGEITRKIVVDYGKEVVQHITKSNSEYLEISTCQRSVIHMLVISEVQKVTPVREPTTQIVYATEQPYNRGINCTYTAHSEDNLHNHLFGADTKVYGNPEKTDNSGQLEYLFVMNKKGSGKIIVGFTTNEYKTFRVDSGRSGFNVVFWSEMDLVTKKKFADMYMEGFDGHIIMNISEAFEIQSWCLDNVAEKKVEEESHFPVAPRDWNEYLHENFVEPEVHVNHGKNMLNHTVRRDYFWQN